MWREKPPRIEPGLPLPSRFFFYFFKKLFLIPKPPLSNRVCLCHQGLFIFLFLFLFFTEKRLRENDARKTAADCTGSAFALRFFIFLKKIQILLPKNFHLKIFKFYYQILFSNFITKKILLWLHRVCLGPQSIFVFSPKKTAADLNWLSLYKAAGLNNNCWLK